MYCLAVIMCQSCTSGMWGRVPSRLVWSRRLVCVYLTAPHSCVLSKCNRRRPHPSEKGILPFPPPFPHFSLLPSPPPIFVQVRSLQKCQQTEKGSRQRSTSVLTVLAQLFSLFKRVCISQEVPYKRVIQAQHMFEGLWQHRHDLSKSMTTCRR